jgi:hypothetical protein
VVQEGATLDLQGVADCVGAVRVAELRGFRHQLAVVVYADGLISWSTSRMARS